MAASGTNDVQRHPSCPHAASNSSGPTATFSPNMSSFRPPRRHADTEDFTSPSLSAPRKRRKVSHACIYCRRSHMTCDAARPCARCLHRNIAHLCRDETKTDARARLSDESQQVESHHLTTTTATTTMTATTTTVTTTTADAPMSASAYAMLSPDTFPTTEASEEYDLLHDFLTTTLREDRDSTSPVQHQPPRPQPPLASNDPTANFYLTAADPAGLSSPADRLHALLRAKYDAGMLKPFNYVRGYARLHAFLAHHHRSTGPTPSPTSIPHRIRQALDRFRPQFRAAVHRLTDLQLVLVEVWLERRLMALDRVFGALPAPACCWRRTGDIVRGNRAMAALLRCPDARLRDGSLALHDILAPQSLLAYWERFAAVAFDRRNKAILTVCDLTPPREPPVPPRSGPRAAAAVAAAAPPPDPDPQAAPASTRCCFSFTIRRDPHNMCVPPLAHSLLRVSLTTNSPPARASSSATSSPCPSPCPCPLAREQTDRVATQPLPHPTRKRNSTIARSAGAGRIEFPLRVRQRESRLRVPSGTRPPRAVLFRESERDAARPVPSADAGRRTAPGDAGGSTGRAGPFIVGPVARVASSSVVARRKLLPPAPYLHGYSALSIAIS